MSVCWVSLCRLKSTFRWNALWHSSQANGLYPVCFLECVMRFELWLNAFPHTWHLCGFSPVNQTKQKINQYVLCIQFNRAFFFNLKYLYAGNVLKKNYGFLAKKYVSWAKQKQIMFCSDQRISSIYYVQNNRAIKPENAIRGTQTGRKKIVKMLSEN